MLLICVLAFTFNINVQAYDFYEHNSLSQGNYTIYDRPLYNILMEAGDNNLIPTQKNNSDLINNSYSSSGPESVTVSAGIMPDNYQPEKTDYDQVTIQNKDTEIPVEISFNENFPHPDEAKDNLHDVYKVNPGESITIESSPDNIYYRSMAAKVDVQMFFGKEVEVEQSKSDPVFEELRPVQYDVMAVDRNSSTVFASRGGNELYKSNDNGENGSWTRQNAFDDYLIHAMFYTQEGTLLIVNSNEDVLRSTDQGHTFQTVLTDVIRWRAFDSIYQDSETGTIMFGEYPSDPEPDDDIRIFKSEDDGASWDTSLARSGDEIRHWHSVQVDPYTGDWIATSGDLDEEVEWWISSDNGESWEPIIGAESDTEGNQNFRTLGLLFTDDKYIWGSDNPLWGYGQNFISSTDRDDPSDINKEFRLPAAAYVYWQFSGLWGIGTLPEGTTTEDQVARIFTSKDQGDSWQETISWPLDDSYNSGGFTSTSPPNADGYIFVRYSGELYGAKEPPFEYGTLRLKNN